MVQGTLSVISQAGTEIDISNQSFWLNGIRFNLPVPVGGYNSSSNLEDDNNNATALRNVKKVGTDQAHINGVDLPLPLSEDFCQIHIHLEADTPVAITSAKFYAYNGIDDPNPYTGINFYVAEANRSTQWADANGYSQALILASYPSSLTHDWHLAVSASPTTTGTKQGKLKFVYTYS